MGLGFRVSGLGFRVSGLGFRVSAAMLWGLWSHTGSEEAFTRLVHRVWQDLSRFSRCCLNGVYMYMHTNTSRCMHAIMYTCLTGSMKGLRVYLGGFYCFSCARDYYSASIIYG